METAEGILENTDLILECPQVESSVIWERLQMGLWDQLMSVKGPQNMLYL